MGRVSKRIEDGGNFIFNIIGQMKGVARGNGEIFGKSTAAIDPDADCIAAQVPFAGPAVPAVTAGDVALC